MLSSEMQVAVKPIKISVVVPVFNPGELIAESVDSLLAQTMPADELELIFVDDGSTDGTPALLDKLAQENPQVRVIHEPASGWSGRPRNVGMDAAVGEYVLFVDQDDRVGEEALARMYAMAQRNDSDIVIGKMIGIGRPLPIELFKKSWDSATIHNSLIIDSLTPHKMFRRKLLLDAGLRFPEGPRRLEDHVFVVAAYFAATRISVLSDYACYFHIARDDRGNAGFRDPEPRSYMAYLAEALDVVDANTEPGPARDRLHRRWLRVELVARLRGDRLLRAPESFRQEFTREARALVQERFAPGVDAGLPPLDRIAAGLLRDGNLGALVRLAQWEYDSRLRPQLTGARWEDGALVLDVSAVLLDGNNKPIELGHRNGSRVLMPPLPPDVLQRLPTGALDVGTGTVSLELYARNTGSGAQHFLARTSAVKHGPGLQASTTSSLPVFSAVADAETLPDGVWEIYARWRAFGWSFSRRVTLDPSRWGTGAPLAQALMGPVPRLATPHRASEGTLRVALTSAAPEVATIVATVPVDRSRSTASGDERTVTLDLALGLVSDRSRQVMVQLASGSNEPTHVWPATLEPILDEHGDSAASRLRASAAVANTRLPPAPWVLQVTPDGAAYSLPIACSLAIRGNGSLRLRAEPRRWGQARPLAVIRDPRLSRELRLIALLPAPVAESVKSLRRLVVSVKRGRSQ